MDATAIVVDAARGLTVERRTRRWAHLSLCVIDAVFSIGARYPSTERACGPTPHTPGFRRWTGRTVDRSSGRPLSRTSTASSPTSTPTVRRASPRPCCTTAADQPRGGILKAGAARDHAAALVEAGVHRYADLPAMIASEERLASVEARLREVRGNGTGDVRLGYLGCSSVMTTS
jgi:hypothetical protein